MKKQVLLFFLLFVTCFAKDSYRIGVLYWSMNIEGQVAMRQGLEREAAAINKMAGGQGNSVVELLPYVAGDDETGIENQIKQFYNLIEKKPDLIIVQPTDNAALAKPLQKANKENIPVIAYDQYISGGKLVSYITSDNFQAGYLGGEYMAHLYKNKRSLSVILIEYPHVSSTVERVEGFLQALHDRNMTYNIIKTYKAVEPVSGKKAGEAIARDFKDSPPDVVFCVNDGGGYAVAKELEKNRVDTDIVTIDGYEKSVEIIRQGGIIKIDSAQFCGDMGATALRTAYDYLQGKQVPKKILIPAFPVTHDNHELYKGWLGDPPKIFEKPWESKTSVWRYEYKETH